MKPEVEPTMDVLGRRVVVCFSQFVLLLLMSCLFSCAAPQVELQVRRPAEVDMSNYRKIAIADFRGPKRSGSQAASILTSELYKTGYFDIFERQQMEKILDEQDFAASGLVDDAAAAEIGKILGVQALIFGEVTTYSAEDQQGKEKVKKQVWTGEYEADKDGNVIEQEGLFGIKHKQKKYKEQFVNEPYIVRSATVGIHFRVVDVNTGQLVAIKSESRSYSRKATGTEQIGKLPDKQGILRDLTREVVKTFVPHIAPYYTKATKQFEKGTGASKQAIKMAQSDLWDEAVKIFEKEAQENPTPSNYYNLGICYEALGMYNQAETQYKNAINLKPKDHYMKALADLKELKKGEKILKERER